jgi:hypothetical protein
MDHDFSNFNGNNSGHQHSYTVAQGIDASAVLLNTLTAFEDLDRLENLAVNEEVIDYDIESFLPSLENIMEFSSYLRDRMEFLLNMNGLTNEPAFEIDTAKSGNRLQVKGARKDIRKINKLLNEDSEIRDGLLTLLSIAGQTYQLLLSLEEENAPAFADMHVVYLYGDGYLSLYKED